MTPVTQHTPQPPTLADTMTALYTRYHAVIRAFILVRVHNPDLADDLTQDVFLNAWRTLATYTGAASHATWLFRIAKNAVIDSGRAHLRLSVAGLPLHGATSKMTASRARKRFLELHRQRQAWRGEETGEASA